MSLGFIIGAVVAIIFYVVATALVSFGRSDLIFGLVALLIWGAFTFNYAGTWPRGGTRL
jgi:hypothetical protein